MWNPAQAFFYFLSQVVLISKYLTAADLRDFNVKSVTKASSCYFNIEKMP